MAVLDVEAVEQPRDVPFAHEPRLGALVHHRQWRTAMSKASPRLGLVPAANHRIEGVRVER